VDLTLIQRTREPGRPPAPGSRRATIHARRACRPPRCPPCGAQETTTAAMTKTTA